MITDQNTLKIKWLYGFKFEKIKRPLMEEREHQSIGVNSHVDNYAAVVNVTLLFMPCPLRCCVQMQTQDGHYFVRSNSKFSNCSSMLVKKNFKIIHNIFFSKWYSPVLPSPSRNSQETQLKS